MRPGINKAKMINNVEKMAVDCGKTYCGGESRESDWYMMFNIGVGSWGVRTGWMTYPKLNQETWEVQMVRMKLDTSVSDIDKIGLDMNVETPKRILNMERR